MIRPTARGLKNGLAEVALQGSGALTVILQLRQNVMLEGRQ